MRKACLTAVRRKALIISFIGGTVDKHFVNH